jgi:hypothetical protein
MRESCVRLPKMQLVTLLSYFGADTSSFARWFRQMVSSGRVVTGDKCEFSSNREGL